MAKKPERLLLLARDKNKCEKSFFHFYTQAFQVLEPATKYKEGWHVEYLCFILQREFERIIRGIPSKYSDIVINVPPRTSKSLIFSVAFEAWAWCRMASFKMITTSYAKDLADNFSHQTQQLIKSDWYRARWPEESTFSINRFDGGKESVDYTVNDKQGKRKTASPTSNLTGFGGIVIIQDDPQSPMQAQSEAETDRVINFYKNTISSRLDDQTIGVIFTIMQRLSEKDMTAYILKNMHSVLHINLPAIKDGTEKIPDINQLPHLDPYPEGVLFAGLLPPGILARIKNRLGDLDYATQYMQSPYPTEGLIVKKEYFSRISSGDFDREFRNTPKVWDFYSDTSYGNSKRVDTDPSATGASWVHNGTLYVRRITSEMVPSEDLPEHLEKFHMENGGTRQSILKIEPRASGPTVLGLLRKKKSKIKYAPYKYPSGTGTNANAAKIERLRACVPTLAAHKVVLIDGAWCDGFIEQVIGFPQVAHDDEVDVLIMMILDMVFNKSRKNSGLRLHN